MQPCSQSFICKTRPILNFGRPIVKWTPYLHRADERPDRLHQDERDDGGPDDHARELLHQHEPHEPEDDRPAAADSDDQVPGLHHVAAAAPQ